MVMVERKMLLLLLLLQVLPDRVNSCSTTNVITLRPQRDDQRDTPLDPFLIDVANSPPNTCTNATILSGMYVLHDVFQISGRSLRLEGEGDVTIKFDIRNSSDEITLEIADTSYVEIIGINFVDSPGYIGIEFVNNVFISQSTFRSFEGGTLDMLNCVDILIEDSIFEMNGVMEVNRKRRVRQGGSGGLSIAYGEDVLPRPLRFLIRNVTFFKNSAISGSGNISRSFSEVTAGETYTGRGGAIFLIMQSTTPVNGSIVDSNFTENFADLYGGAIYIAFNALSRNRIVIRNTRFRNNRANLAGGVIMISYQEGGNDDFVNSVEMIRCRFRENNADYGGAVYFFISITSGREDGELGCFALFDSCTFNMNYANEYGSAIGATALNLFESKGETRPAEITNCTFRRNTGIKTATIAITNFPFIFRGNSVIGNNDGPAIIVIGARVIFDGRIDINNNDMRNISTGALLLFSNGQIELKKGASVSFTGNRGGWGGGIVFFAPNTPSSYQNLLYNPLCPLLYEDRLAPPDTWNVSMAFNDNRAIIGSVAYVTSLSSCSWVVNDSFDSTRAYRWDFIHIGSDNVNRVRSRLDPSVYDIQTQPFSIETTQTIEGYPGELLSINIRSFDELGQPTYAVWRFQVTDVKLPNSTLPQKQRDALVNNIFFDPSAITANRNLNKNVTLAYHISLNVDNPREILPLIFKNLEVTVLVFTLLDEEETRSNFTIITRACPPGSDLMDNNFYYSCLCATSRREIMSCDGSIVFLDYHMWGAVSPHENGSLYITICPSGYCLCQLTNFEGYLYCSYEFDNDNPDKQCACNREGLLCSQCKNDTPSVSVLYNKCTTCHDASSILIIVLIVFDVVLFLVILIAMLPLPKLYLPILFYLQILPLATFYFPSNFALFHPYVYYVASLFSFYFPYDFCLYSNMTTLVSYALKFIPAIIASIIIPTVIIVRDVILRGKVKRRPHHGVFDIIITLYTPTMYAAFLVFECVDIPIDNGNGTDYDLRWAHDANVRCFNDGGHIVLFLLSLFYCIVGVLAIPTSLLFSSKPEKISRVFYFAGVSLSHCYKDEFWYWNAIEFIKRIAVLICIIAGPLNYAYLMVVLTISIGIHAVFEPYRSKSANITDLVIGLLTLLLFLVADNGYIAESDFIYLDDNDTILDQIDACSGPTNIKITTSYTIGLAFLYYLPLAVAIIAIIVNSSYHIHQHMKKRRWERRKVQIVKQDLQLKRIVSLYSDVRKEREKAGTTTIEIEERQPLSPTGFDKAEEINWKLAPKKSKTQETAL